MCANKLSGLHRPRIRNKAMKKQHKVICSVLVSLFTLGSASTAEAVTRVYKISFQSKGVLYPKTSPNGSTHRGRGYLIVDPAGPEAGGNFATITLLPGKKFQVAGGSLSLMLKEQVWNQFLPVDRFDKIPGNDTIVMYEMGEHVVNNAATTYAGLFHGPIPKNGFKLAGQSLTGEARTLKYKGAAVRKNSDLFRRSGNIRLDAQTFPDNVNVATKLADLKAFLVSKGYTEVF